MSAGRSMWTDGIDVAALRDLGDALATPAAPDTAARVRARIEAERPRRASVPWWLAIRARGRGGAPRLRRSILLAAAALLLLAAAVTAAIGYGLPGIQILFGPPPSPTPVPGAPSSSAVSPSRDPGPALGLGSRLSLDEAQALVDFAILLPPDPAIGAPDAVYLSGRRVALVWAPAPGLPGTVIEGIGLLLIELHARVDEQTIRKLIDAGTSVEPITVDGAPGYWISGEFHRVAYVAPDGSTIDDSVRVAGNTVLWTVGGITYKLEGEFTRNDAIALAETLR